MMLSISWEGKSERISFHLEEELLFDVVDRLVESLDRLGVILTDGSRLLLQVPLPHVE